MVNGVRGSKGLTTRGWSLWRAVNPALGVAKVGKRGVQAAGGAVIHGCRAVGGAPIEEGILVGWVPGGRCSGAWRAPSWCCAGDGLLPCPVGWLAWGLSGLRPRPRRGAPFMSPATKIGAVVAGLLQWESRVLGFSHACTFEVFVGCCLFVVEVAKSFPGGWTAVGDEVEADERL